MATRSSHRWKQLPGNFDKLHTSMIFAASNSWGIPDLQKETWVPAWLHPFGIRFRTDDPPPNGAMHFFLDDYRFEVTWTRPWDTMVALHKTGQALSPDFSVYHDWPLVTQLWNVYRNRWLGRFWQEQGVRVIPTLAWSTPDSYDFAFAGVSEGSTVATSMLGVNDMLSVKYFEDGYREMVRRLKPHHVVFYGKKLPPFLRDLVPVTMYDTRWESIRKARLEALEKAGEIG